MAGDNIGMFETHHVGTATREHLVGVAGCPPMAQHHLGAVGVVDAACDYRVVRRPGETFVLACLGGAGRVRARGRWRPCVAGTVLLAPPHAGRAIEGVPGQRWRFVWAVYTEPGTSRVLPQTEPDLVAADPEPLHDAVRGLYREATAAASLDALRHWVELVHLACLRLAGRQGGDAGLRRVWEAVDADLARAWTLADLARIAGVGPEQVRRRCLAAHGSPPRERIVALRLQRAAHLLATTDLSLAEIAERVGYADAFSFSTAFTKRLGVRPSRWRMR